MNSCTFIGNVTRDVELKYTPSGKAVVNFGLAVNGRPYKKGDEWVKDVTFVDIEAWDSGAETIGKHVSKGDKLCIRGELREQKWEKDGQKRSKHIIRCNEFEFLGGKKPVESEQPTDQKELAGAGRGVEGPEGVPGPTGEDIPF